MADSFEQGLHGFNSIPRRRLRNQPKLAEMVEVLKEVEVPTDRIGISKAWKDIKDKVLGKSFKVGMASVLGEQVTAAAVATFGGTYGKLFALGTEIGEILHLFKGKKKDEFDGGAVPQKGEWVAIHNGVERIGAKIKEIKGKVFGDTKLKAPVKVERAVSIGFCMGDGDIPGTKKIFNFETGRPEDRFPRELLVVDKAHQEKLDNNKIWSKIKNIVLGKDAHPAELDTAVPVDPGSEVVYKGEAYTVVGCDGFDARIKNKLRTITVSVSLLTRGRVVHTNSHNYSENVDGGFNAGSKSKLFRGQWVWLPPRAQTKKIYHRAGWELGVLRIINEATADGYYAMDGIRFATHISQVTPCPQHDQDWMDNHADFLKFKIAAVKGVSVSAYKLGRDHMLEVLGLKTVGHSTVIHGDPIKPPKKNTALGRMTSILKTGKLNEQRWPNRSSDQATIKKVRIEAAKEIQDALEVPQNTANKIVNAGGAGPVHENGGNGNGSMILIAALVVGAAMLFYASN